MSTPADGDERAEGGAKRIAGGRDPAVAPEAALAEAFRALLRARAPGASVCPSEAARAVDPEGWRGLMDAARRTAALLADRGEVQVTQRGRPVDVRAARGPVRVRRTPAGEGGAGGT